MENRNVFIHILLIIVLSGCYKSLPHNVKNNKNKIESEILSYMSNFSMEGNTKEFVIEVQCKEFSDTTVYGIKYCGDIGILMRLPIFSVSKLAEKKIVYTSSFIDSCYLVDCMPEYFKSDFPTQYPKYINRVIYIDADEISGLMEIDSTLTGKIKLELDIGVFYFNRYLMYIFFIGDKYVKSEIRVQSESINMTNEPDIVTPIGSWNYNDSIIN